MSRSVNPGIKMKDGSPFPKLTVISMAGSHYVAKVISGLDTPAPMNSKLFHAGSRLEQGQVVTNGGRVLCATALGNSVSEAQATAYQLVANIQWDGMCFRRDIGWRAIARESKQP